MTKVGIIVNKSKEGSIELTASITGWLEENLCQVMLTEDVASLLQKNDLGYQRIDLYKQSDFILVIGGDGTLLRVAREILNFSVPILGINMGHLGFITEVEVNDIYESLQKVIDGEYRIEERMMIEARVYRNSKQIRAFHALNDICLTKGSLSRIITLDIYINDSYVDTYHADGLLISTPTGSTAYSLSAGGPIISPEVKVMLITPICSHSLSSRSMVVSEVDTIKVTAIKNDDEVYLTADGQEGFRLWDNDNILINKSSYTAKFIKVSKHSFYDVLRAKLKG